MLNMRSTNLSKEGSKINSFSGKSMLGGGHQKFPEIISLSGVSVIFVPSYLESSRQELAATFFK